MGTKGDMKVALVSKFYCSSSEVLLVVRKRPQAVNGGGFVVTDCSQKVVFSVDGCGILGKKDELILRDGDADPLLLLRRRGGMIEALSIMKKWKGYKYDFQGSEKLVFSLKEPKHTCLARNKAITISTKPRASNIHDQDWDFEIDGFFPSRQCNIIDSNGNVIAQIGVNKKVEEVMVSKDVYHVLVKPGIDQAFVFGVIALLDYIHGESTRC